MSDNYHNQEKLIEATKQVDYDKGIKDFLREMLESAYVELQESHGDDKISHSKCLKRVIFLDTLRKGFGIKLDGSEMDSFQKEFEEQYGR